MPKPGPGYWPGGGQDTPGIEITPTGRAEAGSRWTGKQPSEDAERKKVEKKNEKK